MNGWNEKILKVDLSAGTLADEQIPAELLRGHIGLQELALKYFDAAEGRIVIMTGALTGLLGTCTNRYTVLTKTAYGLSLGTCGGHFGAELKLAGYDGIVIEGRSDMPRYLFIRDGKAELRCACALWEKNVEDTAAALEEKCFGASGAGTLVIGSAAVRGNAYAVATGDRLYATAAGVGRVFADKNLKGIAALGTGVLTVADPEAYGEQAMEARHILMDDPFAIALGTPDIRMTLAVERNLYARPYAGYRSGARMLDWTVKGDDQGEGLHVFGRRACYSCTVGCRKQVASAAETFEAPAPEAGDAFEKACGVNAAEPLYRAFEICRKAGMDAVKTAEAVGTAMALGLAGKNAAAMLELTGLAATGEGLGAELMLGADAVAEKYGRKDAAVSVGAHTFAAIPALRPVHGEDVEARLDLNAFVEDCGICPFAAVAYTAERIAALLKSATGKTVTADEILTRGRAIRNRKGA